MKFEISVTQSCTVRGVDLLMDTVVAIFKVDADSQHQAVDKVQKSAEYKAILGAQITGIGVIGDMPTYEIE